jgi:hypothetical protein
MSAGRLLGEVTPITEIIVALTVIAATLSGSQALSDRAFPAVATSRLALSACAYPGILRPRVYGRQRLGLR